MDVLLGKLLGMWQLKGKMKATRRKKSGQVKKEKYK
jgi:hypothetical protein